MKRSHDTTSPIGARAHDKRVDDAIGTSLASALGGGEPAPLGTPDTDMPMVSRSIRLPLDTYQRLTDAADARHIGVTTLMRDLIQAGLADLDDATLVRLADVHRALAALGARPAAA